MIPASAPTHPWLSVFLPFRKIDPEHLVSQVSDYHFFMEQMAFNFEIWLLPYDIEDEGIEEACRTLDENLLTVKPIHGFKTYTGALKTGMSRAYTATWCYADVNAVDCYDLVAAILYYMRKCDDHIIVKSVKRRGNFHPLDILPKWLYNYFKHGVTKRDPKKTPVVMSNLVGNSLLWEVQTDKDTSGKVIETHFKDMFPDEEDFHLTAAKIMSVQQMKVLELEQA